MTNEEAKRLYLVRKPLDVNSKKVFMYDTSMESTLNKEFNYTPADEQLIKLATDSLGMNSDCFILYAIGLLGVATKETIRLFLNAMHGKSPDLYIPDVSDCDSELLEERIRILKRNGYIFAISCRMTHASGPFTTTFYTLAECAYNLVKQRLQKRIIVNNFIQAKQLSELIGWSAAGYVGTMIAQNRAFEKFLDRVLKTKMVGMIFMPCEVRTVMGDMKNHIAVIPSYLHRDKSYMTEGDYLTNVAYKLMTIMNYLNCAVSREDGRKEAYVVVAVENNIDLNEIGNHISNYTSLHNMLDRIYFMGEGTIREKKGDVKTSSLQIRVGSQYENGYEYYYSELPFVY